MKSIQAKVCSSLLSGSEGDHVEKNTLVFVVGLHRSGTTLLARCLSKHKAFSGFSGTGVNMDEGQFLQSVMRGRDGRVLDSVGATALKPTMRLTERSRLATQSNAEKLWQEWATHWNTDKKFLVEKSPGNITKTRILQYYFPSAHFIVITRNPIIQVMAIRKWAGNRTYAQHFINWVTAHHFLKKDMGHLRNVSVVQYEELTKNPEKTLSRVFASLGVEMESEAAVGIAPKDSYYMTMWAKLRTSKSFRIQWLIMLPFLRSTARAWGYNLDK